MWKAARTGIALGLVGGAFACSADTASSPKPPSPHGGQTGSLVPECGVAPLSQKANTSVAAGDGAFVVYASPCGSNLPPPFEVRDGGGALLTHHLEPLDDGVYLVRTDSALLPGSYSATPIAQPATSSNVDPFTITVGAPSPLPTQLGTLKVEEQELACDAFSFELTLDEAALAYAPLLRLELGIDGRAPEVWVNYGTLPVQNGKAKLQLPRCFVGCLNNGAHELSVTASIAGESAALPPIVMDIPQNCPGEPSACALRPSAPSLPTTPLLILALTVLLPLARWRRAR